MRITGGSARGRVLAGPSGRDHFLRPTTDRVREAVFAILGRQVAGARVADLYCGTGAYGLESLSRGAAGVVFVDRSTRAMELLAKNCRKIFPEADIHAFLLDLSKLSAIKRLQHRLAKQDQFELIFLDPPYKKKLAQPTLKMIDSSDLAAPGATVIVEEHKSVAMPEGLTRMHLTDQRQYGESKISFYVTTIPAHRDNKG
jgi:16S rRNA (guanine966-N2)-methyltransferase